MSENSLFKVLDSVMGWANLSSYVRYMRPIDSANITTVPSDKSDAKYCKLRQPFGVLTAIIINRVAIIGWSTDVSPFNKKMALQIARGRMRNGCGNINSKPFPVQGFASLQQFVSNLRRTHRITNAMVANNTAPQLKITTSTHDERNKNQGEFKLFNNHSGNQIIGYTDYIQLLYSLSQKHNLFLSKEDINIFKSDPIKKSGFKKTDKITV
jgi:hypothetical protein